MAEEMKTMEKVYCCASPQNNDALWASLINNRNASDIALMNGGMGGFNNPILYLFFLMFARGNGWGDCNGNAYASNINSRQLSQLQEQVNNNQNSSLIMDAIKGNGTAIGQLANNLNCDFNTLSTAICNVRAQVEGVAGQVGYSAERVINAVNLGDANIVAAFKDCCCATQKEIIKGNYENQLASERQTNILGSKIDASAAANQLQNCQQTNTLNSGIERVRESVVSGFSQLGYQTAQDTASIITAINDSQRRTADMLNSHWQSETQLALQDEKFKNSQLQQNIYLRDLIEKGSVGCGCGN